MILYHFVFSFCSFYKFDISNIFQINVSSGGISVVPDINLIDLVQAIENGIKKVDIIVLPGGQGVDKNVCDRIKEDTLIRNSFIKLVGMTQKVLTICTGSFIIPVVLNKLLFNDKTGTEQLIKTFLSEVFLNWTT